MEATRAYTRINILSWMYLLVTVVECPVASELISSHQPIIANPGDDVILPCQLRPAVSADSDTIMWTKAGLEPKYVHYHQDGQSHFDKQHPSYYLHTRLFMDELLKGNVSMQIFKVKKSDAGLYKCAVSSVKTDASIQLIVRQLICPRPQMDGEPGQTVILEAYITPPLSLTLVEWTIINRPESSDCEVHVNSDGKDDLENQCPEYINRAKVSPEQLQHGNASLMLTLNTDDTGTYQVLVKVNDQEHCHINLTVQTGRGGFIGDTTLSPETQSNKWSPETITGVVLAGVLAVLAVLAVAAGIIWMYTKKKCIFQRRRQRHDPVRQDEEGVQIEMKNIQ